MTPLGPFPDIELAVCRLILPLESVQATGVVTPEDLAEHLVFARVVRIGGGSALITDAALVDVDVFGATRDAARDAAEDIRQLLIAGMNHSDGVTVDRVDVISGPTERPWSDEIRRWHTAYRVSARR